LLSFSGAAWACHRFCLLPQWSSVGAHIVPQNLRACQLLCHNLWSVASPCLSMSWPRAMKQKLVLVRPCKRSGEGVRNGRSEKTSPLLDVDTNPNKERNEIYDDTGSCLLRGVGVRIFLFRISRSTFLPSSFRQRRCNSHPKKDVNLCKSITIYSIYLIYLNQGRMQENRFISTRIESFFTGPEG